MNPIIIAVKHVSMSYLILYVVLSVFPLFYIYKHLYVMDIAIYIFCIAELLLSLVLSYHNLLYNWLGIVLQLCFIALPWFCVGIHVTSIKVVYEEMVDKSPYILATSIVMMLYVAYIGEYTSDGNMAVSYALVPYCAIIFDKALSRKKMPLLIVFALLVLFIVIYGSRGPLVAIGVFCVFYIGKYMSKHKVLLCMIIVGLEVLVLFWNQILNTLYMLTRRYGIYSRTLSKLFGGTILNGTGRSIFFDVTIEAIQKYLVTGMGIAGERPYLLANVSHVSEKTLSSVYPHNFILEFLVHYGVVLGAIFVIGVFYFLVKGICEKNVHYVKLVLMLGLTEIVHLLLSSTYTVSPLFFFFLGLSLNKKIHKEEELIE